MEFCGVSMWISLPFPGILEAFPGYVMTFSGHFARNFQFFCVHFCGVFTRISLPFPWIYESFQYVLRQFHGILWGILRFFNGILLRFHVNFLAFPRDLGDICRTLMTFLGHFARGCLVFSCIFVAFSCQFPYIFPGFGSYFTGIFFQFQGVL